MLTDQERAWLALPPIPPGQGAVTRRYRWSQNLTHVEVAILLPPRLPSRKVREGCMPLPRVNCAAQIHPSC